MIRIVIAILVSSIMLTSFLSRNRASDKPGAIHPGRFTSLAEPIVAYIKNSGTRISPCAIVRVILFIPLVNRASHAF